MEKHEGNESTSMSSINQQLDGELSFIRLKLLLLAENVKKNLANQK